MYADPAEFGSKKKPSGLVLVVALHIALGFSLYQGMRYVHIHREQQQPLEVKILPEIKTEQEKPKAPDPVKPKEMPPIVPPPVVDVPPPPAPTIVVERNPEPPPSQPPSTTGNGDPGPKTDSTGGVTRALVADGCTPPEYPKAALRNGDSGTVELSLLVGPDGRVQDSRVDKTSGHKDLDRAARVGLSQCHFQVAMNDGHPVAAWGRIAYVWKLND